MTWLSLGPGVPCYDPAKSLTDCQELDSRAEARESKDKGK